MNPYLQLLLGLGLDYGIDRWRHSHAPPVDAQYVEPPTPPVPQIMAPVDAIDFIEHLENERAAHECGCEDY